MELELARLHAGVNSDNERTSQGCNSLDALVKSVRTLTLKVPNRPEGWAFFFASLEKAFASKNVPVKLYLKLPVNKRIDLIVVTALPPPIEWTVNRDLFVQSVKRNIIKRYIMRKDRGTRKEESHSTATTNAITSFQTIQFPAEIRPGTLNHQSRQLTVIRSAALPSITSNSPRTSATLTSRSDRPIRKRLHCLLLQTLASITELLKLNGLFNYLHNSPGL
ncbi:hypothetical protein TNIN_328471 [Trichonephila inaurata madagascariensis]|uniref:Uncharacterized protein n=1 Tax=Trichonephila inaurata madagascariensis TaxID=2747483 RepID=A0A8X6YHD5_9ARAC|nr:hypothetical protein TNIN_328471 [Trichonephila inaurata madagascariensis]